MSKTGIKKRHKWTYWQFVFWGFNFIVGLAYLIGLNQSFVPTGNLMILTIISGSAIAYFTGLGFAKLSVYYHSNGGAFLYCKHAFSRRIAWFVGFFQYIQAPFVAVAGLFGILWAFQGLHLPNHTAESTTDILSKNWWLFVIDFLVFLFIQIVLYFGFTSTKIVLYLLLSVTILTILFSIVISLRYSSNFIENVFHNGYKPPSNYVGGLKQLKGFIISITTFFFAYGGFEGVAIVADDVENPKKNFGKAMITIIISVGLFYILWYYLYLGAFGVWKPNVKSNQDFVGLGQYDTSTGTPMDYNPFIQIFRRLGVKPVIFSTFGASIVWLLWVFSQVSNKGSGRLMTGWVNAKIIGTIAEDGLLPRKFAVKNKYDQFANALILDGIITFVLITSFYMVYHFTNYSLADTLDLYTISAFIQYIGVVAAVLVLNKKQKISNVKKYEVWIFILTIFVLLIIIFFYFFFGFQSFIQAIISKSSKDIIQNIGICVTTGTFMFMLIVCEAIYIIGKKLGWSDHINDDNEAKNINKMDKEFAHNDFSNIQSRDNF